MRVLCMDCGSEAAWGAMGRCAVCGGILQPDYDDENIQQLRYVQPGRGIDRYRALMPVEFTPLPYLGEGDTPLIRSKRIGPSLGLENLYFKNEGLNPSGAFKDRAGAAVAALALEAGAAGVVSASSGNASSAIAAYCAAARLKCVILMEPGNPPAKLRQTLATGAQVLLVEGIFAHGPEALATFLNEVALRADYYLGFVWAPVNPYILEGIKTIAYEVAGQLGGAPDVVLTPVGGGDMFAAQWRGYNELKRAGVIDKLPRMIGVQSVNAPPLYEAVHQQLRTVATLPYAKSKISGINVPFTGDHALAAVHHSGGTAVTVADEAAYAMQKRIATEEGIWIEPAGAAPITALADLLQRGLIQPHEKILCVMSGAGFKDANLAAEDAGRIGQQPTIPFDVDAVSKMLTEP
ncbi:MAG: threonine synthase [Anaerolineaceae bacterium]|nr:threonine synthase [Anaerolineaceae bacterium]